MHVMHMLKYRIVRKQVMTTHSIKDPLLCNGSALRKANRRVSQLYDTMLAPTGINCSQHSILVHVERLTSPSMTELAHALVLGRSALAHNLKPLERDGLVLLAPDEFDRRSRRVSLSAPGKAKLAECRVVWAVA